MEDIFLFLFGILVFGGLVLFLIKKKKITFSQKKRQFIMRHLREIESSSDKEKIIELDKILDECLQSKNISGSLGEKMKKYGKQFENENAIWNAHKLRNKLVHEIGFIPTKKESEKAISAFLQEIEKIIGE